MFNIFNKHKHQFKQSELLYSIDKDIDYSTISEFGFTKTYRVKAVQIYKCECGKRKVIKVIDKIYYQDNPLDKDRFINTVRELLEKGYSETNLI